MAGASGAGPASPASRRRCIGGLTARPAGAFVNHANGLAAGGVVRFGDEGKVCFLGQLDATVEAKGEDGEVTLAFAFHGAVLDEAINERGAVPLPPYIATRRAPGEGGRLPC